MGCFLPAMAQSDRGTITGTVSDPAGAVIPSATVTALHKSTGATYPTVTTRTGDYTLPSLPSGVYDLTIEATGFSKYIQEGIDVQVAQTARVDITMKVGATTDSVTVNADAPLLKTESAEQSQTLAGERVNELPLTLTSAGVRNPIAFAQLQPGVYAPSGGNFTMQVNGVPGPSSNSTYKTLMDGQDITSGIDPTHLSETQPSVEALQEMTLQASNFAAEFGQVGGGLINFTSKSGTNEYHGSLYEYWTNRVLNAGIPFTNNGHGGLNKPVNTNNDFDMSLGGPLRLPKIYDGRNKTFFFFNLEEFFTRPQGSGFTTVPTMAMRGGDFSAVEASAVKNLGTAPNGMPIAQYEIFDPMSNFTYNGQTLRLPFAGNIIPPSRIDPVVAKVQALIPTPTNSLLVNNLAITDQLQTHTDVPSLKVDHIINEKNKVSFYWGEWHSFTPKNGADALPYPLSPARHYLSSDHTLRLSYDRTITPTMLLHVGFGELRYDHIDSSPQATLNYDAVGLLGLVGSDTTPAGFPRLAGLNSSAGGGPTAGGFGPVNANNYYNDKPTAVSSLTSIKGDHTYKFGAEWRRDIWEDINTRGSQGIYNFSAAETGLPYLSSTTLNGGNVGFPYASFLLGAVDNATVSNLQDPQLRKIGLGFYAQDTWKITHKLTLDYGVRYDLETVWHEIHNRMSSFEPNVVNPSAGGLLGGTEYPGNGPGECKCQFAPPYKFGIGPRLGVAYQIDHKTVVRSGIGVVYGRTSDSSYITNSAILGTGFNTLAYASPAFGIPEGQLQNGLSYTQAQINSASLNPGIVPYAGQLNPPPYYITQQGGRPPRILQWNVSVQREITRNLVAEVAFVGNTSVWDQSDGFVQINSNSIASLAKEGFNIVNNPTTLSLLTSNWNSPQAVAAGIKPPYPTYPVTTVAQLLRPFPQFTTISTKWSANGDSWYDGLQAKLTQRLWHGIFGQGAFAWQKALDQGIETPNDITNRAVNKDISAYSQPFVLSYGISYTVPAPSFSSNKLVRNVLKDWTLSGFAREASGMPIQAPALQNNLQSVLFSTGGFMNRVPGVPLFTHNLNCHCIDPNDEFVLNPAAWTNPTVGTFGNSAAYYNDYRFQRRPTEQFGVGRIFRIKERATFQLRAEFYNVFNRTEMANPVVTNALATQTYGSNGLTSGGFGWINSAAPASQPRNGQLLARINF
jgi:hypothetical protein